MGRKRRPNLQKTELPLHLDYFEPEYENFVTAYLVPEDKKDITQKDLPYKESFLSEKKSSSYQKLLKERQARIINFVREEERIIEKLREEGAITDEEARNRIIKLPPVKNYSEKTNLKYNAAYGTKGKEFLPCVCGAKPVIIKGRRVGEIETFCIHCPQCHMATKFLPRLDFARNIWNAHAIHGANNQDKMKDYPHYVFGQGMSDLQSNGYKVKITGAEKYANEMELLYTYDLLYAKKINAMLERGMSFKEYEDLCLYLNEEKEMQPGNYDPKKDGPPKYRNHIKWWKRFFDFERIGRKIIITEVYHIPIPWSGDKEFPNRGRTLNSYKPRLSGDGKDGWIGTLKKQAPVLYRRAASTYATQEGVEQAEKIKKARERKRKREEIEEKNNMFYEIYEDDDLENWEEDPEEVHFGKEDIDSGEEMIGEEINNLDDENYHETEMEINNFSEDDSYYDDYADEEDDEE